MVLLVIPLTIYLVQQQQDQRSQAAPSTVLSFSPTSKSATKGDDVSFDINLAPGSNVVVSVKLVIKFDSTKLSASAENFTIDPASNLKIQEGPVIENGVFAVSLLLDNITENFISETTKIGTISFKVINDSGLPTQTTQISFDPNATQIRSTMGDNQDTNVFLSGQPATITITSGVSGQEVNLSPTTSIEPGITSILSPVPTGDIGPASTNEPPICSDLTPSGSTTGNAPFELTFTANGTDTDGSIIKATFDFDDSTVKNVTTGGGLGTSSVNVPITHTYYKEGEYTASVVLTDNQGDTSQSVKCTASITVVGNASEAVSNSSPTNDATDTTTTTASETTTNTTNVATTTDNATDESTIESSAASSTASNTDTSPSPMPPTGPNERIVGIGALGGLLFLIGTLLFLAL